MAIVDQFLTEALALHAANHAIAQDFSEKVYAVASLDLMDGCQITLMYVSPPCKHFAKAKGDDRLGQMPDIDGPMEVAE